MSSRTPQKNKSATKKTPIKSTSKHQEKSQSKSQVQSSAKKNRILISEIKESFLKVNAIQQQQYIAQKMSTELNKILGIQNQDKALEKFEKLVCQKNFAQQIIEQSIRNFDENQLGKFIKLLQRLTQSGKLWRSTNLSVWISALAKVNQQVILSNSKIRQYIDQIYVQTESHKLLLRNIRGKIALLTGL